MILTNRSNKLSLKVISLDDQKQKIIVPVNHRETLADLIEQNVDLFVERDTNLGKTNIIKMSIDTGNHCCVTHILYISN